MAYSFWLRALGVPAFLAICAYLVSMAGLAERSIFAYLFLIFLLFVDVASLVRGRARSILVVLSSLTVGLCIVEAAALAMVVKPPIADVTKGLMVARPVLGWGPAHPGVYHSKRTDAKTGRIIYDVNYTFDDDLLRRTISAETGPTIAFFGDSFTLGEGVNDQETMPQAFADLTDRKLRVLNFGFSAYSPQQFLRAMETGFYNKQLGADPRLFVFLTAPWQSERVACKVDFVRGAPRYVLHNGSPVFDGACYDKDIPKPEGFLEQLPLYHVLLERYFRVGTKDDIELYIAEILKAAALAKERYHVPTVVLYMTAGHDNLWMSGFTDDQIMQRLRDGGVSVVDASLAAHTYYNPKLSIPGDGHPTPYSHHARAVLLKQFLAEKMPEILAPPHS